MDEKKTRLESKGQEKGVKTKAAEVKDTVSEKGEEVKIKATEAKDTISDKSKEIKEKTTDKTDDIRATAEKVVNDVLKTFKEKQEGLGKTINDYTAPKTPYVDLVDTPTEFILIADLPEVSKDDLSVDLTPESVIITATFPEAMEGEDITYIKGKGTWRSYPYSGFTRRDQDQRGQCQF